MKTYQKPHPRVRRTSSRLITATRPLVLECAMYVAICCFLLLSLLLCYTLNPMSRVINLLFTESPAYSLEYDTTLSHRLEAQATYVPL
jgi:hypothetical protein